MRQGHEVTLFATGDSVTSAELVACFEQALRFDPEATCAIPHHLVMLNRVFQRAWEFHIIHFHIDYLHFPLFRCRATNTLTTLHGRLDLPFLVPAFSEFREMPLVSISNDQRKPLAWANWTSTVYHGLPGDLLPYRENRRSITWRFSGAFPEKRKSTARSRSRGGPG